MTHHSPLTTHHSPLITHLVVLALSLTAISCSRKSFDGPTVDSFTGRLTHNAKPVSFPAGDVVVTLVHEKGESFGIPIQPDGSFKIGWMPTGKYSATLTRASKQDKGGPIRYNIPGGLTIDDGKTDYTIELGTGWKP
jgi:hypothetical protein